MPESGNQGEKGQQDALTQKLQSGRNQRNSQKIAGSGHHNMNVAVRRRARGGVKERLIGPRDMTSSQVAFR